jgi:hypothetical protein
MKRMRAKGVKEKEAVLSWIIKRAKKLWHRGYGERFPK